MRLLLVLCAVASSSSKYAANVNTVGYRQEEYSLAQAAGSSDMNIVEGKKKLKCVEDGQEGALHHELATQLRKNGHVSKAISAYRNAMALTPPVYKRENGLALEYADLLLTEGVSG